MGARTMWFVWPVIAIPSIVCSAGALGVCRAWPNWPAAFVMAFVTTMFATSAVYRRFELAEEGIDWRPRPWKTTVFTGLLIIFFSLGCDRIFGLTSELPRLLISSTLGVVGAAWSKSWADRQVDPEDEVQVTSAEFPRAKSAP